MEGMSYIGGPGASLFLEEQYGMKNLRARECTGEFLIFKHIESVIFSFSGLEKSAVWRDDARLPQGNSSEPTWLTLRNP